MAANHAAGKMQGQAPVAASNVERFYPDAAQGARTEGSTVVRYWLPPGSDVPTDCRDRDLQR
jgi:hypothetical protein